MPDNESLHRLGGGRWETRDGRFAIEPLSGTWVIVDNEQTDELGLPLVRGPFGSLTAAKEAIEAARMEGPKASPLAERIEKARQSEKTAPKSTSTSKPVTPSRRTEAANEPEPPPEPRWLRELEPREQRQARDLITRLEKMRVADPERIVRAEIADGEPALARLALERAIDQALARASDPAAVVRAVLKSILRGADVELGVSWKLVDDQDRRIEKLDVTG